jgi:hypothetical protein
MYLYPPAARVAQLEPRALGCSYCASRLVRFIVKSKPKLSYDRRPVGQSVLVSGHHLETEAFSSFPSMEIIYQNLRPFLYGASSLMRGMVLVAQL